MGLVSLLSKFTNRNLNSINVSSASYSALSQSSAYPCLENSAFWACLMNLCRTFASLPLHVYSKDKGANYNKTVFAKLLQNPCPYMNAYTWRFIMAFNFELYGRAYALVVRNNDDIVALYPLSAHAVNIMWENGEPVYSVYGNVVDKNDILRIDNTPNGITRAFEPIEYAENDLKFAKNAQSMASSYYDKASFVTSLFQYSSNISEENFKKIDSAIKNNLGANKAFGYMLMPSAVEYKPITFTELDTDKMVKAQSWSVDEVARRFGVPPFFVGDLTKATYANTEQQGMQLVTYCILPRAKAWECALETIVDSSVYVKFALGGLMRADHATRSSFYHNAILDGYMSVNEVRELEDLTPLSEEEGGNKHWFPLNYTTLDKAGETSNSSMPFSFSYSNCDHKKESVKKTSRLDEKTKLYEKKSIESGKNTRSELERLFRSWVRLEFMYIKDCKTTDDAITLLKSYMKEHQIEYVDSVKRILEPLLNSLIANLKQTIESNDEVSDTKKNDIITKYATSMVSRHFGEDESKLQDSETVDEAKEKVLTYIPTRTEDESNRLRNAMALETFVIYRITEMRIVNSGSACEFCSKFGDRVLEVNKTIVNKGEKEEDSAGNTFTITKSRKHPPLHSHCSCSIAPYVREKTR